MPGYLKKVVAKLKEAGKSEDEIKNFQNGVQNYYKEKIAPNFKDYEFFIGESMSEDGMYGRFKAHLNPNTDVFWQGHPFELS